MGTNFIPFTSTSLQTFLTGSALAAGDLFGEGMAISTDTTTLAVGAVSRDSSFANQGSVFVFKYDGGVWSQQAEIVSTTPFDNENFGRAISLSGDGNTLAVGSYIADAFNFRGCVYVYTRAGSTWTFQQKLTSSTAHDYAEFGWSTSLSDNGNVLAVGEQKQNAGGTERGRVHIYTRSGSTWTLDNYFDATTPVTSGLFGSSVSISSNGVFVAVGASGGASCYMFENVSGTWTERAVHTPTVAGNIVSTNSFGQCVAISSDGTKIVSCAPTGNVKNSGGTSIFGGPGWARLLTYSSSALTTTATFIASSPQTSANMGSSVSADWTNGRIALGSPTYDAPSRTNSGRVHIFTDSGGSWSETKVITRAVTVNFELFGAGVALYGTRAAIGVPQATFSGISSAGMVDLVSVI